jgi:hypothetical protein
MIVFRTAVDSASRLSAFWATAGTAAAKQSNTAMKVFFIGAEVSFVDVDIVILLLLACEQAGFTEIAKPQR